MRKIHPVVLAMTVAAALTTSSCFAAAASADVLLGEIADGAAVQETLVPDGAGSPVPQSPVSAAEADGSSVDDKPADDATSTDDVDLCGNACGAGGEEGAMAQAESEIDAGRVDGGGPVEAERDDAGSADVAGQQPCASSGGSVNQGQTGSDAVDAGEMADAANAAIPGAEEADSTVPVENLDPAPVDAADSIETTVAASPIPPSEAVVSDEVASLAASGPIATGWQQEGDATFYYGPDGTKLTGQQTIEGATYYFDPACDGAMATGLVTVAEQDGNGASTAKTYYYGTDGKMVTGEVELDERWYYFDPIQNGLRTENAFVLLSGAYLANGPKMVYYGSDGKMLYGEHIIDGYRRWFDPLSGATDKIGYQNPIGRFQVSANSVLLPWYTYGTGFDYVTPSRIGLDATREDCIEAFVNRAYEYLGTPYRWDYALAPGVGVDCSGLVMQCLYAAGMNLGDYNPYKHITDPWHSHDANNMAADPRFTHVDLTDRQRGDLLFYPGHVAIYLGNDQVINAYPPQVQVQSMWTWGTPTAVARPFV